MPRLLIGISTLALAALAITFTGCSSIGIRQHAKADVFSHLSAVDQKLVRSGRVREGFSKDAVFIAWGKPDKKRPEIYGGAKAESWLYLGFASPSMTQKLQLRPRQRQVVVWTETYRQQTAYRTAVFKATPSSLGMRICRSERTRPATFPWHRPFADL